MNVRAYLALTAATILVPVVLFSAAALESTLRGERESVLRSAHETARTVVANTDRDLASAIAGLLALATSPYLASGKLPLFYEQALAASGGDGSWTVLFDHAGRQLLNTRVPYGVPLPVRRSLERSEEVMRTQQPSISNLATGLLVGRYVVAVDVPVPLGDGTRYVLGQAFTTDYFERAFPQRDLPDGWIINILDRDGKIILRNQKAAEFVGKPAAPELLPAVRERAEGVLHRHGGQGELIDVYSRSPLSGWTVVVSVPAATVDAVAWRAAAIFGLGLLAAIACAGAVSLLLGRRLAQAIDGACNAAAALGRGELPAPAPSGVAEIDRLHAALQNAGDMLRRECASRSKLESEREQFLANEQEARKMAESQSRAKDEFIALLGHELRNPLSAITAAVALLESQELGEDNLARARGVITRQSQHLSRIIDDLLDLSRVLSGKVLLDRHRLDLAAVARQCVAALAAARRIEGHAVHMRTDTVWIDADQARIEQIINNLLLNAAKYTPTGGSIELTVRSEGDDAVLTVRDTGIGIAAQLLPNIFDVFVQGPAPLDGSQDGLGIGLALVRRLVRLHGGTVLAASAGDGQGSTFTVRLPLAMHALPGEPAPRAAIHPTTKCRVLLVDDNEDGRQTLGAVLTLQGHQVSEAADGRRGLLMATSEKPDVAVIDIGLPGIDGYELARQLRAAPGTSRIRLIALTGYGQPEDRRRAVEAGFDMYLVKPVEPARLVDAITTMNHARM
jgi:signal transduction histidine kinase/ActR/RegA family two-component response regulator